MQRDYDKVLKQFEQITKKTPGGVIMCSDLENIAQNNTDLFALIGNAIKYGYVMGYNRGVREQRARNKRSVNNGK